MSSSQDVPVIENKRGLSLLQLVHASTSIILIFIVGIQRSVNVASIIGTLWSIKNVTIGPLKKDLGIITCPLNLVAFFLSEKADGVWQFKVFTTIFIALHFGAAAVVSQSVRKGGKSEAILK